MLSIAFLIIFFISILFNTVILKLASNYAGATDNNWSRVLLIAFIAALLFSGLDLLFNNFIINLIALAIALIVIAQLLKVPNDMLTVFVGTVFIVDIIVRALLVALLS